MMVMMEASPSRVRMEVGGAATWNLPHVFRTVLHMSCEVRSAYSFEVRRARCPWTPPPPPACPRSPPACPPPSTLQPGLPLHARDHWPQGPLVLVGELAFSGRWGFSWVGCCSLFVWRWAGARGLVRAQREGRLAHDESGVEMKSVYGHCSLNQPSSHQ